MIAVLAVLVAWHRAPSLGQRQPAALAGHPPAASRQVRRICALALVALAAGALGLNAFGAPLAPNSQPLTIGDAWGGDDPLLIAVSDVWPGTGQFQYAYEPGAEIRTGITLANQGNAPLTVTGLGPPAYGEYVAGYKFLLPPGPLTAELVPVYPGEGPIWTSEPFHPFEIPAHGEVGLALAVDLRVCPQVIPGPTLAPGASPSYAGLDYPDGFGALAMLDVAYSAFGIARTASVPLQTTLDVVTGNPPGSGPGGCSVP